MNQPGLTRLIRVQQSTRKYQDLDKNKNKQLIQGYWIEKVYILSFGENHKLIGS